MLVVLSPQEGESLVPCGQQCVCAEEEHAFLKINPERSAVLVLFSRLAKDVEDYQVRGEGGLTEVHKKHGGVLKEGFLLNILMSVWSRGHACWRPCGKSFGHRVRTGGKHVVTHK